MVHSLGLSNSQYLGLYRKMLLIRLVEESIADNYPQQKMRTPVHLSIGQEAAAVAFGANLNSQDYAVSTHRGHAHYLAKGGDLKAMLAEIHGKVTGCCRGRGGSMHLIDEAVGFMGSTAIVGNTIPIGVGLGLSAQLSNSRALSCIFLGDGAVEEGVFYESLNFAVLKNLPVLFACENNRYSVYSHFNKRQPAERKIYEMVAAMGAKVFHADGYDLLSSYSVVNDAVTHIRSGNGPAFVELETYRWREHCGPNFDNDIGYRTEEEYQEWKKRDPVASFKKYLIEKHEVSCDQLDSVYQAVNAEVAEAMSFAMDSDFPDPLEAVNGQYKESALAKEEAGLCVY